MHFTLNVLKMCFKLNNLSLKSNLKFNTNNKLLWNILKLFFFAHVFNILILINKNMLFLIY